MDRGTRGEDKKPGVEGGGIMTYQEENDSRRQGHPQVRKVRESRPRLPQPRGVEKMEEGGAADVDTA